MIYHERGKKKITLRSNRVESWILIGQKAVIRFLEPRLAAMERQFTAQMNGNFFHSTALNVTDSKFLMRRRQMLQNLSEI